MPQQIISIPTPWSKASYTWSIRSTPQSDKYIGAVELTWSDGRNSVTGVVSLQGLMALFDAAAQEISDHSTLLARQLAGP